MSDRQRDRLRKATTFPGKDKPRPTMVRGGKLIEGNLYRVQFKQQAGNGRWYLREMTAVFLTATKDSLTFSLRPLAGSTTLSRLWNPIVDIELVERNINAKYRHGVRDKELPVKLSRSLGATERPEGL